MNASAVVYYVDGNNGNDSNSGTASAPWKTISKANSTLVAGDTVFIKQGVYSTYIAPAASGASGKPITYQNYSNDVVSIQNTTYGVWLSGKSWIVVKGISCTNLDHMMIIENSANHNEIANCNFQFHSTIDCITAVSKSARASLFGVCVMRIATYSGRPSFLRRAFSRASPRTKSNSGYMRSRPSRTGPSIAMRSNASRVRSLSPNPAKVRACAYGR